MAEMTSQGNALNKPEGVHEQWTLSRKCLRSTSVPVCYSFVIPVVWYDVWYNVWYVLRSLVCMSPCTLNIVHWYSCGALYIVHVHCTLITVHQTLYITLYFVHVVHCTLVFMWCIVHCSRTLHIDHCASNTVNYIVHYSCGTLYIVHIGIHVSFSLIVSCSAFVTAFSLKCNYIN